MKPFGFELDDKRLKRAGLDYWKHLTLFIYESVEDFYDQNKGKEMVYFSSHGKKDFWSIDYKDDLFLIFGKESKGLSKEIVDNDANQVVKIPLYSPHIRSLNLANAVGVVVYEGLKSLRQ